MINKEIWLGACVVASTWIGGIILTRLATAGTSGSEAYAILAGWCLVMYVSAKFSISPRSAMPLVLIYLVFYAGFTLMGIEVFYRQHQSMEAIAVAGVGIFQALIFISPILLNHWVDRLFVWIKKRYP
ncbi:hypothetical protein R0381_001253 [Jeongeupia wiesaeckerbachi]|uniref:hypothetical protein n=1 Tax=Jeongeupia wiesaeckerbachi TaxID=3051218 RepID=UPI003D80675B